DRILWLVLALTPSFLWPAASSDRIRPRENGLLSINELNPKADKSAKTDLVVRHLDKKVNGLHVAETTHFRILHDLDKKVVEKVGKVAESSRVALQKKWFGDVSTDWD